MAKLTPVFRLPMKPTRVGVYQAEPYEEDGPYYSWWCGKSFHGCWESPRSAFRNRDRAPNGFGISRVKHWRGLTTHTTEPALACEGA